MFNRHFILYIIGVIIVVFLFVSYTHHKAYQKKERDAILQLELKPTQNHVEFHLLGINQQT